MSEKESLTQVAISLYQRLKSEEYYFSKKIATLLSQVCRNPECKNIEQCWNKFEFRGYIPMGGRCLNYEPNET